MSDRRDLQAVQEPLKQCYREEPSAALVTVSAAGALGEGVTCSVSTGRAMVQAGLHPATGGDGLSLCSGDMLLEALVACAGVTLRAVATSLELPAHPAHRALLRRVADDSVIAQGHREPSVGLVPVIAPVSVADARCRVRR